MKLNALAAARERRLALLALAIGYFFPLAARAENVQVTVLVILASDQETKADPRLQCVAQQVRKKHPELKGFRVEEILHEALPVGKKKTFELIDGQKATVKVLHGCDEEERIGLTVTVKGFGEMDYKCCCGKFLPLMTDYRTKDKERLLVAIRVQPCKKSAAKKE
jgi:hypothetical protein